MAETKMAETKPEETKIRYKTLSIILSILLIAAIGIIAWLLWEYIDGKNNSGPQGYCECSELDCEAQKEVLDDILLNVDFSSKDSLCETSKFNIPSSDLKNFCDVRDVYNRPVTGLTGTEKEIQQELNAQYVAVFERLCDLEKWCESDEIMTPDIENKLRCNLKLKKWVEVSN